jgi:quercetin dioxygenase-like cupin family protein
MGPAFCFLETVSENGKITHNLPTEIEVQLFEAWYDMDFAKYYPHIQCPVDFLQGDEFMKIYRFDAEVGKSISKYESRNFIMSRIARFEESEPFAGMSIGCMHIGPDGVVGWHQAACPQLFLVVQGEGWVKAGESDKLPIKAGYAAFWETGEFHESGSDTGMTVIVIESEALTPDKFMPEA